MLNKTNLARIDLNLLVLFEAVLEELHVARAAVRLHVSPSAVSHGLGRLRRLMHDPLFLKQPKGVVPTDRARQLAAPVAEILARARQVLDSTEAFDARRSRRRFMVGAPDGVSAVLLPPLLADLREAAPGIDLGVRNLVGNFDAALTALDHRELDVALLPIPQVPARFASRKLYDEEFVVVRREGHPIGRRLTSASYCEALHLVVSMSGDPHGPVDIELAKHGKARRVVLTVSNFMQALAIVSESDLIGAMPANFVRKHAGRFKVVASEMPFSALSSAICAVATHSAMADAGIVWLMATLERAAKHAKMARK